MIYRKCKREPERIWKFLQKPSAKARRIDCPPRQKYWKRPRALRPYEDPAPSRAQAHASTLTFSQPTIHLGLPLLVSGGLIVDLPEHSHLF